MHHHRVAMLVSVTVCAVLTAVVIDLFIAAGLSATDRAASLAALGAIGAILARGLANYIGGDDDDTGF